METITIGEKYYSLLMERESLMQEANNFLDEHEDERGDLSAKDTAQYKQLRRKIDRLTTEIEVEGRKPMPHPDLRPNPGADPFSAPITNQRAGVVGNEYRKNFIQAFRTKFKQAHNYLREANSADGGYLLPESFSDQLIMKLAADNVMRQISKVITTASEHQINLVASEPAASWVQEGEEIQLGDAQFGRATLSAFKLCCGTKISNELLSDSYYDLEAALIEIFSRSIATAEEQAFISGNGTTEPQGILTALSAKASSFITTKGAEISADDVINLQYSLKRPYRKNAVFLCSDAAISHLRKLKDSTQNFLWQNSLTEAEPPSLLGAKVYTSPFMPAVESGACPILYGDFSNYFIIGDRGERVVKPLRELYALSDCTAYLMIQRVDSRLINDEAIRGLKIK